LRREFLVLFLQFARGGYPPERNRQSSLYLPNDQGTSPAESGSLQTASPGTTGILAALDAGVAITIFPEYNLPNTLKSLGSAEALPPLPDFEFVLRRSWNSSLAADHLADMIIDFFQLSTALRPGNGMIYKQRSHLLLRTGLEA
jgi:hypothetical protein